MELIVDFKRAYGATLRAVEDCLATFFPELLDNERTDFIYSFFPYLFGLHAYAVGTVKQRLALKEAKVNYTFYSVYQLTFNLVKKLLDIEKDNHNL